MTRIAYTIGRDAQEFSRTGRAKHSQRCQRFPHVLKSIRYSIQLEVWGVGSLYKCGGCRW
jgi:hypothetical protein